MLSCPNCGTAVTENERTCLSCGAAPAAAAKNEPALAWNRAIPLATNRSVVRDLLLVLFIPALIAGVVFSLLTGAPEFFLLFLGLALGLFILGYIIMAVLQLGGKGGLDTYFFISSEGVAYKAGEGTRLLDLAATMGSAVSGSAAGTGAGLLALSSEANTIFWDDVRYVRLYPDLKMVQLRSRTLINPVPLYCTDGNYPVVLAMVRQHIPNAVMIREG